MLLREWLRTKQIRAYKFAEIAGVTPATISRCLTGKKISQKMAMSIEKATEGGVSRCEAFFPELGSRENEKDKIEKQYLQTLLKQG